MHFDLQLLRRTMQTSTFSKSTTILMSHLTMPTVPAKSYAGNTQSRILYKKLASHSDARFLYNCLGWMSPALLLITDL